jgi:hypothetical protein
MMFNNIWIYSLVDAINNYYSRDVLTAEVAGNNIKLVRGHYDYCLNVDAFAVEEQWKNRDLIDWMDMKIADIRAAARKPIVKAVDAHSPLITALENFRDAADKAIAALKAM